MQRETGPGRHVEEKEEAKGRDVVSSGRRNTHLYIYTRVHGRTGTREPSHWETDRWWGTGGREHVCLEGGA